MEALPRLSCSTFGHISTPSLDDSDASRPRTGVDDSTSVAQIRSASRLRNVNLSLGHLRSGSRAQSFERGPPTSDSVGGGGGGGGGGGSIRSDADASSVASSGAWSRYTHSMNSSRDSLNLSPRSDLRSFTSRNFPFQLSPRRSTTDARGGANFMVTSQETLQMPPSPGGMSPPRRFRAPSLQGTPPRSKAENSPRRLQRSNSSAPVKSPDVDHEPFAFLLSRERPRAPLHFDTRDTVLNTDASMLTSSSGGSESGTGEQGERRMGSATSTLREQGVPGTSSSRVPRSLRFANDTKEPSSTAPFASTGLLVRPKGPHINAEGIYDLGGASDRADGSALHQLGLKLDYPTDVEGFNGVRLDLKAPGKSKSSQACPPAFPPSGMLVYFRKSKQADGASGPSTGEGSSPTPGGARTFDVSSDGRPSASASSNSHGDDDEEPRLYEDSGVMRELRHSQKGALPDMTEGKILFRAECLRPCWSTASRTYEAPIRIGLGKRGPWLWEAEPSPPSTPGGKRSKRAPWIVRQLSTGRKMKFAEDDMTASGYSLFWGEGLYTIKGPSCEPTIEYHSAMSPMSRANPHIGPGRIKVQVAQYEPADGPHGMIHLDLHPGLGTSNNSTSSSSAMGSPVFVGSAASSSSSFNEPGLDVGLALILLETVHAIRDELSAGGNCKDRRDERGRLKFPPRSGLRKAIDRLLAI